MAEEAFHSEWIKMGRSSGFAFLAFVIATIDILGLGSAEGRLLVLCYLSHQSNSHLPQSESLQNVILSSWSSNCIESS